MKISDFLEEVASRVKPLDVLPDDVYSLAKLWQDLPVEVEDGYGSGESEKGKLYLLYDFLGDNLEKFRVELGEERYKVLWQGYWKLRNLLRG